MSQKDKKMLIDMLIILFACEVEENSRNNYIICVIPNTGKKIEYYDTTTQSLYLCSSNANDTHVYEAHNNIDTYKKAMECIVNIINNEEYDIKHIFYT